MSCDHQLLAKHVHALLDDSLLPILRERCEHALQQCEHCREVYAQALSYQQMAAQWQEEEVPHWQRLRHLAQPKRSAVQPWFNWVALAASTFALFLIFSKAEISTEQGLVISFAGNKNATITEKGLAATLTQLASEQQQLNARFELFAQQQQDSTELLIARWQEANRSERRQELNYLLTGWQNQRYQDQQAYTAQLTELANEQIENNHYLNTLMKTVAQPGRRGL